MSGDEVVLPKISGLGFVFDWRQKEHRDHAGSFLLVIGVIGVGRHRALPPQVAFFALEFTRDVIAIYRAVLQLDVRFLFQVVVPHRVVRSATKRCHHRVLPIVLHAHQRSFADFPALCTDGGQHDDRHPT